MTQNSDKWGSTDIDPATMSKRDLEQLITDALADMPGPEDRWPVVIDHNALITHIGRAFDLLVMGAMGALVSGDYGPMADFAEGRKALLETLFYHGFQAGQEAARFKARFGVQLEEAMNGANTNAV